MSQHDSRKLEENAAAAVAAAATPHAAGCGAIWDPAAQYVCDIVASLAAAAFMHQQLLLVLF